MCGTPLALPPGASVCLSSRVGRVFSPLLLLACVQDLLFFLSPLPLIISAVVFEKKEERKEKKRKTLEGSLPTKKQKVWKDV